jgi:hypothetical protein
VGGGGEEDQAYFARRSQCGLFHQHRMIDDDDRCGPVRGMGDKESGRNRR